MTDLILISKQPGIPRTVSETREAIMMQLVLATHAAAEKPVKNAITSSGVKDSFAMPVLNQLIAKGKILRRSTPTRKALTPEMVNKELYEELMKKTDVPLRSPLLEMEGMFTDISEMGLIRHADIFIHLQVLMSILTHLSSRSTRTCLVW